MADVEEWLTGLKLTKYIQVFADHGVDSLEKAGALTSDKLTEMGITLQGHRNRILKHLPSAGATDEQQQAQLEQQEQQEQQEQPQEPSQPQTAAPAEQQQDEAEAGPEAAPAPPRPAPKPKPKPKPKPRTDSLSAEQPPAAENNGTPTQQQQQQEEQQHVQEEQQEEEQQQEGEQQVQHGAQSEEDDVQEQANPEPVAAQNTGAASTKEETIDQLDNILGDIENMLGDLDGPHMAEETGQGHDGAQSTKHIDDGDYEHNADTGMASSVAVLSSMQDSDLDDLLADLCSFGTEGDKVVERDPVPVQKVELVPEVPKTLRPSQRPSASLQPAADSSTSTSTPLSSMPEAAAMVPGTSATLAGTATSGVSAPQPTMRRQMSARPGVPTDVAKHLDDFRKRLSTTGQISQHDLDSLMKEEKIRIAMEKMAAAQNQQVVIKVTVDDGTTKTLCIEAQETAFEVCRKLVVKNRFDDSPFWQLVEECPTLGLEREYEDHEVVSYHYNAWPPFSDYKYSLRVNEEKYGIFVNPEKYFPHSVRADIEATAQTSQLAGNAKRRLFQEYFSNTARVPDVKGFAQIKEGKKWKKRFCVLRASGVYFSAKGESEASRDLQVYVKFDEHYVCTPLPAFLTKLKAPTHFAIAFRPNIRKRRFEPQDIPTMTFSSDDDRNIWLAGIRFAVFGANLREGYEETCKRFDKLAELGEFNPDTAKQFKAPTRQDVRHVNKKLVQKWQSMRAASSDSPNVSAATGVEFDDFADDSKSGDGKNGEKDSITSQLLQHAWFHGALSRDAAEALLRDYNFAQGAYLVRESTSHPGDYVISLCFESKPHHYKVKKVQGSGGRVSFGLDQGPRFPYLPDLITHYSGNVGRLPTQLALAIPRKN